MIFIKLLFDFFEFIKGFSVIVNVSGFLVMVIILIDDFFDFESGKKYVVFLKLRGIVIKLVIVIIIDWDEKRLNEGVDYELFF